MNITFQSKNINNDKEENENLNNDKIDFNAIFFKELQEQMENEENYKQNNEICLLSHENLVLKDKITLRCGHSFNHFPLYNEVFVQKVKNSNIGENRYLKENEFFCPYCREKQVKLLPYVFTKQIRKVPGVNSPKKYTMMPNKCTYVFKSGKNKNLMCNKACLDKYCDYHLSVMAARDLKNQNKMKIIHKNISVDELFNYTVKQLIDFCKENGIKKYSRLKKKELVNLIKDKIFKK